MFPQGDGLDGNTTWYMVCLMPLFDPPRHDTKATIDSCRGQGIEVKMITGDHLLIGKETAKMLGMGTEMYASEVLIKAKNGDKASLQNYTSLAEMCEKCNGFAEVFPEHKWVLWLMLGLMLRAVHAGSMLESGQGTLWGGFGRP